MKNNWKIPALILLSSAMAVGVAKASWSEAGGEPKERCEGKRQMMEHRMNRPDLNLSADQARTLVSAQLIMRGNDRLKVGEVAEKDENTYSIQIVTLDGSLVREIEMDKHEGPRRPHGGKHH